jgi:hypothetical protein
MKAWLIAAIIAQAGSQSAAPPASRLPASANRIPAPAAAGSWPVHVLFFHLKARSPASGRSLQAKLRARFPELSLVCEAGGVAYVNVTPGDAARLLGPHAVLRTIEGMGNAPGADAHTARVARRRPGDSDPNVAFQGVSSYTAAPVRPRPAAPRLHA